jgi:hypothetical protein
MPSTAMEIRTGLEQDYADVLTPRARAAIAALAPLDDQRRALMQAPRSPRGSRTRADAHRVPRSGPDDSRDQHQRP